MRSNVCLLTPHQAVQLEINGIVPSCREHRHLSRIRADELIREFVVFRDERGEFLRLVEARWIGKGKKYLAFVRSRMWKRMDSGGTVTMQLVPGGA